MDIDDKSMEGINENKININLGNNAKELLKFKRTNKFFDGWLQGAEFQDWLEKINKMREDDFMQILSQSF